MTPASSVPLVPAEELAARTPHEAGFLRMPTIQTVFAERAMRLRQLAAGGHALGDYLLLLAHIAQAQQHTLLHMPDDAPLPDAADVRQAALLGQPPLPAAHWPRSPIWHGLLRDIVQQVQHAGHHTAPVQAVLARLADTPPDWLEQQAAALLQAHQTTASAAVRDTGPASTPDATPQQEPAPASAQTSGQASASGAAPATEPAAALDMAALPFISAALQVYWTHLAARLHARPVDAADPAPLGRIDDATACPCCGSPPALSVVRHDPERSGQRYLHCGLCNTQWHMVRIKCSHCQSTQGLAYHSLHRPSGPASAEACGTASPADAMDMPHAADMADVADVADDAPTTRAAVQVETCDQCQHYLKIVYTERDPHIEGMADDIASLPLDLLIAQAGYQRQGINPFLPLGSGD